MIVEIPSYIIVLLIVVLLLNILFLFNNIYKNQHVRARQAGVAAFTALTLSFYVLYAYFALVQANKHKMWEYDSNLKLIAYKKAQFLIDSVIKMNVLLVMRMFLIEINSLWSFGLVDNSSKSTSVLFYVIFRIFVVGFILDEVQKDYAMFVVASTVFEMAETFALLIFCVYFIYTISMLRREMEIKLVIDYFAVENLLKGCLKGVLALCVGFCLEIVYRAVFLHLATAEFTKINFLIKETFMILRIISICMIFTGINLILSVHESAEEEDLSNARALLAGSKFTEDSTSEKNSNSDDVTTPDFTHLVNKNIEI